MTSKVYVLQLEEHRNVRVVGKIGERPYKYDDTCSSNGILICQQAAFWERDMKNGITTIVFINVLNIIHYRHQNLIPQNPDFYMSSKILS